MGRTVFALALAGVALAPTPAAAESLDQIVTASLAHSPWLAAARAREDAAKAQVDEVRAEHMPTATAQGQIGVGRIDPQGFFGLSADNVTPRSAQITLELPLFTGGRIDAARVQAEGGRAAAQFAAQATALNVRVEVVKAYSQALAAQQEVASYTKLGQALDEALRQARLKYRVGEGTSTDIAQADARRAEAQAGLAAAQGSLETALARLSLLAGKDVSPSADLPPAPQLPATSAEAVELALARNPGLQRARKAADAARGGVSAARAEELPSVGLYAEGASVRDEFFPGYKADSASVGVRASWNFFSGGRVSAKVRGAEANERAARSDADAAALEVEGSARQTFASVTAARSVLKAATARDAATQEALRGTRLEVSAGAKPQLALLDAEREAIQAESSKIAAEGQLLVFAYTLLAITGRE
ncbi:MAG TPA: TolC family protein [Croceibacterium sp.]|jgi:outer membrane protein|nr:TolC family protein [Croceibacterium sp.]